ncbi:endonuclease, partial [Bacteroidota bacterium]
NYYFRIQVFYCRTSSKESYMIIYNAEKVEFVEDSAFVVNDKDDVFEREPYIAKFKTEGFDFFLVNIHIKPDNASDEIKELSLISSAIKNLDSEIIIVGDFNADCSYFDETLKKQYFGEEYVWKITDEIDTTTKKTDCTYDRIIFSDEMNLFYANQRGVLHFNKIYNLDYNQTIAVSDHYPVWANFRIK